MADRWMDERDREQRERDWRRSERYGRGARSDDYNQQPDYLTDWREDRSWEEEGPETSYAGQRYGDRSYGDRGYGRDRVFGERETGASYGQSGGVYQGEDYGRDQVGRYGQDYRRYGPQQDFSRGGRYYGDDSRQPLYREEFGQGGAYYGPTPSGYRAVGGRSYGSNYPGEYREEGRGYRGEAREIPNVRGGRNEGGRGWWDRARDQVASWLGDEDAQRRHDWDERRAGHRGRGPKGYRRSDQRISDDVHDRLTDDPWLDASAIEVAVKDGEVTLTGTVIDRNAKHHAERIIEDVSGVDHVQNNLRIQNAGSNPITGSGRGFGDNAVQASSTAPTPTSDPTMRGAGKGASTN